MKGLDLLDVRYVVAFVLVFTRLSGVFLLSPLLSNRSVPDRVKVPLIIMLSFLLLPFVSQSKVEVSNHIQLLVYIFEELTIGLVLGFVASLIFATIQVAGEIFGMQIGYSIATILDPANNTDSGVLTTLYIVLGAFFFLYLDGHHAILSSVSRSFEILPLATGFSMDIGYSLSHLAGNLLVLAIQISAPVIVVVSILNIIFGLITKIAPQMNIYFNVGLIVGPLIGVGVLMLSMPLFKILIMKITSDLSQELLKTVHELKGV